jgi:hypothetical protein
MNNFPHSQPAILPNLIGPNLPPVALAVSAEYQFCVDAGIASAMGFFEDLTAVGLHDHIAYSMHVFMSSVRTGLTLTKGYSPARVQACNDAFAAGYLGRIQQELRLFHGEESGHRREWSQ